MEISKYTKYIDRTFWVLYFFLLAVAIIELFSASSMLVFKEGNSILGPIGRQILFLLAGCLLAFVCQFVRSKYLTKMGYIILGFALLCLYSLLIPGNPYAVTFNGATRWIRLAGIVFQPAEVGKLGLIIVVADLLTKAKTDAEKRKAFYQTLLLTAVTCLPIMKGNLSTALLLAGIVLLMWFLARVPWKYILVTIAAALVMVVAAYFVVEYAYVRTGKKAVFFKRAPMQVKRVDDFFAERKQPATTEFRITDDNRQRSLSKVAVMRGGWFGVGPGQSQERDYLPLAYEDYIFAIIVEESGIFGACALIFLYLAILFRACFASTKFRGDERAMLTVMGLALMITCQAFVSMAVSVGLGPVTGQPLPLISHGGTSAIVTSLYFGIMMAVSREQEQMRDKQKTVIIESNQDVPVVNLDE